MLDIRNDTRATHPAASDVASQDGFVPSRPRIFLLSPANASGIRGQRLLDATGKSELALRLRGTGVPLGEVYRFISSLYFRGKLEYAQRFQNPPRGIAGVQIITGSGVGIDLDVILLGSIATSKYIAPIQSVFGERLLFPQEFVGRGDMSRGSMLLRCCVQGAELQYMRVENLAPSLAESA